MSPTARPRVEGDRELEILAATLDLLVDVGYDRLTMDAVAVQAKASKATLYRRWDTKANLVLEALLCSAIQAADVPDTGSLRGDLIAFFCAQMLQADDARAFGAVITAVASDPEFAGAFRERFLSSKLEAAALIYGRAAERGELRDDIDFEIVAPALPAVVMHRALLLGRPVDEKVIERVVDNLILPAVLAPPTKDNT